MRNKAIGAIKTTYKSVPLIMSNSKPTSQSSDNMFKRLYFINMGHVPSSSTSSVDLNLKLLIIAFCLVDQIVLSEPNSEPNSA